MKPVQKRYLIFALAIVGLGLLVRVERSLIPEIVDLFLGDALYATMMYFVLSFLFPDKSFKIRAVYALIICWSIEFQQLYTAPWIVMLRATTPFNLILGQGFLWSDLAAYIMGIALAICIDIVWIAKHVRNK